MRNHPIEEIAIGELREFADNPRSITPEGRNRLRRSLDAFGLYRPLVVWRDESGDPIVIAGNQRLAILREILREQKQRNERIPCVVLQGVDRRTAQLIALRDNNEEGEWQWEALTGYLADLSALSSDGDDIDWTLTGFEDDTLAGLLALSEHPTDAAPMVASVASPPILPTPAAPPRSQEPEEPEEPEAPEEPSYPERRFTRVAIGAFRGEITPETYSRFLRVWTSFTEALGSTEPGVVVAALARAILAHSSMLPPVASIQAR